MEKSKAGPRERFQKLVESFDSAYTNREREARSIVSAYLACEHVFMLGPPGTAKSMLARHLAAAVGGSYFETLVSETTTPDEVVGGLDLKAVRERGEFRRNVKGMLPDSQVAFVDEVFNCNSPTLKVLQGVMNERVFHNGGAVVQCPLESMITASNKLPDKAKGDLQAFYDRILVRLHVTWTEGDADWRKIVFGTRPHVEPNSVSRDDVETARDELAAMPIPTDVQDAFSSIRANLRDRHSYACSDRRWQKIGKVLTAYSWLLGYDELHLDSFEMLPDLLWREPSERSALMSVVGEVASPALMESMEVLDSVRELVDSLPDPKTNGANWLSDASKAIPKMDEAYSRVEKLAKESGSKRVDGVLKQVWAARADLKRSVRTRLAV